MKILTRYVLVSFLRNYLISFLVLIGLYVVLDMVFQFDEFAKVQGKEVEGSGSAWVVVRHILDFYSYQIFVIFAYLSGVIPVLAAAFTIIRMTRFNEMTAMMAAGVPLLRVATPIIICGVVLNFILLPIDQELIIPKMIPMLIRKHDQVEAVSKAFPIGGMQDGGKNLIVAARYNPGGEEAPASMEFFSLIERDSELRPIRHTKADAAVWDDKAQQWNLTNGITVTGLQGDEDNWKEEPATTYRSNVTPEEIMLYRSGDYVELLPTRRIDQLLNREDTYGTTDLLRVKHTRWVQWPLNILLLLLALACLLTRDPSKLKLGIMRCAVLTGLCMGAIFLSQQLAGHPQGGPQWQDTWPAVMAWLPILIFGPAAVFLLDRVNTKGS